MAGTLNTYGYSDSETKLINSKYLEEEKQNARDKAQDVKIQKNTNVNDEQVSQINDLYERIEKIPSGGTVTDLDMGGWS